jgi:chemotaxis-related protein WspD
MSAQAIKHCWRKIGVYSGDHSCARLREVVHCRNCDVYAAAARSVMLRELEQLPEDFAPVPERESLVRSALLVRIGGLRIGLAVARVIEIATDAPLRRVPHRSGRTIAGLTNVRGQLHLTLVPERLFGVELNAAIEAQGQSEAHARPRIVLLSAAAGQASAASQASRTALALRADNVLGVHGFTLDALAPIPALLPAPLAECANAVGYLDGKRYFLLDDLKFAKVLNEAINA